MKHSSKIVINELKSFIEDFDRIVKERDILIVQKRILKIALKNNINLLFDYTLFEVLDAFGIDYIYKYNDETNRHLVIPSLNVDLRFNKMADIPDSVYQQALKWISK